MRNLLLIIKGAISSHKASLQLGRPNRCLTLAVLLLNYLAYGLITTWAADRAADRQIIEAFSRSLEQDGIPGVLSLAKTQGDLGVSIHSDYWVQILAKKNPDQAALEQAKREFGRKLAVALEVEAKRLQQPASTEERMRSAQGLFDFSDWLTSTPGYGNYLLVNRCQDLVTVPIAYLIADTNCPLDQVEAVMKRFLSPEDECSLRVAALKEEALDPRFKAITGKRVEKTAQLGNLWGAGVYAMIQWIENHKVENRWDTKKLREKLPEDLIFYCDDETQGLEKLTLYWDLKKHHRLVSGGILGINRESLDSLMLFRRKVGYFPTKAIYSEEQLKQWAEYRAQAEKMGRIITQTKYSSEIEEGFDQAWEPFRRQYGPHASTAARVFEMVIGGKYYDYESTLH